MGLSTFLNEDHPPERLRGLRFLAFGESVVIQRPTVVSDSGGGGTTTWANVGTAPCRVTALGGAPRLLAGRIDETSTHMITAPEGTDVTTHDRAIVAGRGTLDVTGVYDSTNARDVRFEVVFI